MSKLEVEVDSRGFNLGGTKLEDIPVATVFFGSILDTPSVFLRIFDGLVDLRDPQRTWSFVGGGGPRITNYRPATRAKLAVE